jgi:hypothetical protein
MFLQGNNRTAGWWRGEERRRREGGLDVGKAQFKTVEADPKKLSFLDET